MGKDWQEVSTERNGDMIKIEIRDSTYRVIYRGQFNIRDKNSILSLLAMLEKFSGLSIVELIKLKLDLREWW